MEVSQCEGSFLLVVGASRRGFVIPTHQKTGSLHGDLIHDLGNPLPDTVALKSLATTVIIFTFSLHHVGYGSHIDFFASIAISGPSFTSPKRIF